MTFENPWDIEKAPSVQRVTSPQDTEEFWVDISRPAEPTFEEVDLYGEFAPHTSMARAVRKVAMDLKERGGIDG